MDMSSLTTLILTLAMVLAPIASAAPPSSKSWRAAP
jgi:hypothetical protein